ncbi:uncharacterized protein J7T54_002683 [Emericellopsis cladophorae]|uniref:Uncharacterized protein n=1 Tax=Emericellopsis cladophorae TaxID=2686198 RepID=A0A9Q0B7L9_9HYPO|nr:uncharacterized protein J7T54_002683 [Emericellopsis cladophorae]KAI6777587.1 hypothetical protein J7T54_002683 [Emericellopsis cladophorae]
MNSSASTPTVSIPVDQSTSLSSSPSENRSRRSDLSHATQTERTSTGPSKSATRSAGSKWSNSAKAKAGSSSGGSGLPFGPPITKATLSDLDVVRIVQNSKLRHDINFDPDLHFRPINLSDKGKAKQERSQGFWKSLTEQLGMFVDENRRLEFMSRYARSHEWCLPVLLRTIKDIVETLVPKRSRDLIDEAFNVELLMQEFYKGVLDSERLAEWLAGVLKTHCAPMRDNEVNNMVARFRVGSREGNLEQLVMGMRELLSVLENMKLDVANHQICRLRPALIQETTHYEKRNFSKKIATRRLDIARSRLWYHRAQRQYAQEPAEGFGEMSVFFRAVAGFVRPSRARGGDAILPETFLHDNKRLLRMRSDVLDAVKIDVCMHLYDNLIGAAKADACFPTDMDNRSSVSSVSSVGSVDSDGFSYLPFHNTVVRPSRMALSTDGQSPRSSLGVFTLDSTPPQLSFVSKREAKMKAGKLYSSLVAIFQSTSTNMGQAKRWAEATSFMAVEILRAADAPSYMLAMVESKLGEVLSNPNNGLFLGVEAKYHHRLVEDLSNRVREYKGLDGMSLYTAAVDKRTPPNCKLPRGFDECLQGGRENGISDVAIRLAHVGILHWRVWADLAY